LPAFFPGTTSTEIHGRHSGDQAFRCRCPSSTAPAQRPKVRVAESQPVFTTGGTPQKDVGKLPALRMRRETASKKACFHAIRN